MGWTTDSLIKLVEHIDLPGHDRMVRTLRRWAWLCAGLGGLFAALFWTGIAFAGGLRGQWLIATGVGLLPALILLSRYRDVVDRVALNALNRVGVTVATLLAALCLIVGALLGTREADAVMYALIYGAAGGVGGYIAGMFINMFAELAVRLVPSLFLLPGWLLSLPLVWLLCVVNNFLIRRRFPEWRRGKVQVVKLSTQGAAIVSPGHAPLFVASPALRRDGKADAQGIPRFNQAELLSNPTHVGAVMAAAAAAAAASYAAGDIEFDHAPAMQWFNPATGLPMLGDMPGGIDVGGTLWCDPGIGTDFSGGATYDFSGGGHAGDSF